MSSINCDFCGSDKYKEVYKPIGTKRNNRVCICQSCGLVFSIHDDVPYSREPMVSGDADWGNVRFCKGQRFDVVKDMLPKNANHILDVGSSRGDFVRWARQQNPEAEIVAVEPDTRVIDYWDEFGVIGSKLEDVGLPENHFDFVYCMQTLEHVDSASAMLKQIYDYLAPDGVLFLEVPNIEAFKYEWNVEESFIDKHNFHFQKGTLVSFMTAMGFDCAVSVDNLNVAIFAAKVSKGRNVRVWDLSYFNDTNPHELIVNYAETIQRNRAKLPAVVERINEMLDHMKVSFFGANTLFDLMVKYGGLDPNRVECLVDDYLCELVSSVHGVPVQCSDAFRVNQPDVCVILARHSADAVAKRARSFGIRNIVKFYDLIRSA